MNRDIPKKTFPFLFFLLCKRTDAIYEIKGEKGEKEEKERKKHTHKETRYRVAESDRCERTFRFTDFIFRRRRTTPRILLSLSKKVVVGRRQTHTQRVDACMSQVFIGTCTCARACWTKGQVSTDVNGVFSCFFFSC